MGIGWEVRTGSFSLPGGLGSVIVTVLGVGRVGERRGRGQAAVWRGWIPGDLQDGGRRWGVDEVCVGSHCHESSTKLRIKWGAGVVANEGAESRVRSSTAGTAESIAEKAGPTDSLTRSCEPLVDGAAA